MTTRSVHTLIVFCIALASAASLVVYDKLPDVIATHWDSHNSPNGYSPKLFGLALMPALLVFMYLLFIVIPRIDPLKKNIAQFSHAYNVMFLGLTLFLTYVHGVVVGANLFADVDVSTLTIGAIGPLFILIGYVLGTARRNWFVGIRTPWTLSSDHVWDRTHRLGKLLYVTTGVATTVSVFADPVIALYIVLVGAIGGAVVLIVYSYVLYRREKQLTHE